MLILLVANSSYLSLLYANDISLLSILYTLSFYSPMIVIAEEVLVVTTIATVVALREILTTMIEEIAAAVVVVGVVAVIVMTTVSRHPPIAITADAAGVIGLVQDLVTDMMGETGIDIIGEIPVVPLRDRLLLGTAVEEIIILLADRMKVMLLVL